LAAPVCCTRAAGPTRRPSCSTADACK
jgi:hypothetical protein